MTHKEKIELLKNTIKFQYEKEGKSINYISKLLEVDRKILASKIKEWKLIQANSLRLNPSTKKFLNKYREIIISRLNAHISIKHIASELNISYDFMRKHIYKDKQISVALEHYHKRIHLNSKIRRDEIAPQHKRIIDLNGEIWKQILGYENYYISNMGRFKKYLKSYDFCIEIKTHLNYMNNSYYVSLGNKNLSVARLIGHNFIDGYSEINNTINHKNGNRLDDRIENLEWYSQSENNKHSYQELKREKAIAYSKHGKFKKIILDDKYEFKTIVALAKFLNKSTTQVNRYIDGKAKTEHTFKFIY